MSDEHSQNPDTEILNSIRPPLATTRGPLILISSPYATSGQIWEMYRKHFSPQGDPLILVAQGASRDLNPTLDEKVVERALARDRAAAAAEYLAQLFRSDLQGFVALEVVQGCVGDYIEQAPRSGVSYRAFCDRSLHSRPLRDEPDRPPSSATDHFGPPPSDIRCARCGHRRNRFRSAL
jgi:hypothetical protein